MKKKCLENSGCPLVRGYNVIGDWWSLLIISRLLLTQTRRFSELQTELGMAKNILTARLRKLVEGGVLQRVPTADGSAYHEYLPTQKGLDLLPVVVALRQWGEAHFCAGNAQTTQLVDRAQGKAVPSLEVRAADGRVLGADDVRVEPLASSLPPST